MLGRQLHRLFWVLFVEIVLSPIPSFPQESGTIPKEQYSMDKNYESLAISENEDIEKQFLDRLKKDRDDILAYASLTWMYKQMGEPYKALLMSKSLYNWRGCSDCKVVSQFIIDKIREDLSNEKLYLYLMDVKIKLEENGDASVHEKFKVVIPDEIPIYRFGFMLPTAPSQIDTAYIDEMPSHIAIEPRWHNSSSIDFMLSEPVKEYTSTLTFKYRMKEFAEKKSALGRFYGLRVFQESTPIRWKEQGRTTLFEIEIPQNYYIFNKRPTKGYTKEENVHTWANPVFHVKDDLLRIKDYHFGVAFLCAPKDSIYFRFLSEYYPIIIALLLAVFFYQGLPIQDSIKVWGTLITLIIVLVNISFFNFLDLLWKFIENNVHFFQQIQTLTYDSLSNNWKNLITATFLSLPFLCALNELAKTNIYDKLRKNKRLRLGAIPVEKYFGMIVWMEATFALVLLRATLLYLTEYATSYIFLGLCAYCFAGWISWKRYSKIFDMSFGGLLGGLAGWWLIGFIMETSFGFDASTLYTYVVVPLCFILFISFEVGYLYTFLHKTRLSPSLKKAITSNWLFNIFDQISLIIDDNKDAIRTIAFVGVLISIAYIDVSTKNHIVFLVLLFAILSWVLLKPFVRFIMIGDESIKEELKKLSFTIIGRIIGGAISSIIAAYLIIKFGFN